MNKKIVLLPAVAVVVIAFFIVFGTILGLSNGIKNATINPLSLIEPKEKVIQTTNQPITQEEIKVPLATTMPIKTESIIQGHEFASIIIATNKKTRTNEIMESIDEKTLKKNIGHLPSSSLPGQDGICVLMGHRDTDFKILKYAQIGDIFTVKMNGIYYKYSVTRIDI